jgi:hypothetical protein
MAAQESAQQLRARAARLRVAAQFANRRRDMELDLDWARQLEAQAYLQDGMEARQRDGEAPDVCSD